MCEWYGDVGTTEEQEQWEEALKNFIKRKEEEDESRHRTDNVRCKRTVDEPGIYRRTES